MSLQEVEEIVLQLEPRNRLKLAATICRQLGDAPIGIETEDERRNRRLAAIARCDAIAGGIDVDFDSAEDLRRLRAHRIADIS